MANPESFKYTRLLGAEIRSRRMSRGMSLRGLAKELGLSGHGTLVDYEHGRRIPPQDIVDGCERVFQISDGALRNLREKALSERANRQTDRLLNGPADSAARPADATPEPTVERRPEATRSRHHRLVLAALAAVLVIGLGIGVRMFGVPTPHQAPPPADGTMSGPSCMTGDALPLDTSGSWTTLGGDGSAGCGPAVIHKETDSGDGANWIFHPGVGKTCLFRVHIPDSPVVTARNVTYQAWDTQPGEHHDVNRIGDDVHADQQANRGGEISVTFGPTKNGTIDLQLYDNFSEDAVEAADTVTATCR